MAPIIRSTNSSSTAVLRLEEIATDAALERLRPDWSALWQRAPSAGPFQHPDWLLPWWRELGGGELFVFAVRDGADLVALAPFYIFADAVSGERQLTLLGNGVSDSCDVLRDPACAGVGGTLADALRSRRASWTTYDLRDLPPGAMLPSLMGDEPDVFVDADTPTVVVNLDGWADGRAALSPKMAADLRRCRKRAEESAVLRMEFVSGGGVGAAMDALFALHGARWRARGEAGVFDGPRCEAFYREIAARFGRHGWLRLLTLSLDDRVVGASLDFQARSRAYHYIGGFDPQFGSLAIGRLMLQQLIARAVCEGAHEFDFLRGQEDYKRRWGGVARPQYRIRTRQSVEAEHAGGA